MRVLFLEDSPPQRRIISKFLSKTDVIEKIEAVSSVAEARDAVNREEFDLLILDVMMPGNKRGGIEFLYELRKEGVKTPVILYTAADFNIIRDALEDGINCLTYIPKDTPIVQLANKVREFDSIVSEEGRSKLDNLQSLAERVQTSFRNGEERYNQVMSATNGGV